jgi:lipase
MNLDGIHTAKMGQGARPALLLHCALGHSGGWQGIMARLNDLLRATAFDQPGHGQSADWTGEGAYHNRCTQIGAALLTEPMDLIGHSFGATLALRLAVEFPHLVRRVVLFEPVFFAVVDSGEFLAAYRVQMAAFRAAVDVDDLAGATQQFMEIWGDGTAWADFPFWVREKFTRQIPIVNLGADENTHDIANLTSPGRLEACVAPILIVTGACSPPIIGVIQTALAARLPNATTAVVDGTSHMLPITHPAECADLVRLFLCEDA